MLPPVKHSFKSNIIAWDEPGYASRRENRIQHRKTTMKHFGKAKENVVTPEIGKPVFFIPGGDNEASKYVENQILEREVKKKDEEALRVLWKMLNDEKYSVKDLKTFHASIVSGSYDYPEEFKPVSKKYVLPTRPSNEDKRSPVPRSLAVKIYDVPSDYTSKDVEVKLQDFAHHIHKIHVYEYYTLVSFRFSTTKEMIETFLGRFNRSVWDGSIIQITFNP